ncbi:MAG: hypothetical protein PSX37_02610 [bacterium]|nr:hypothetical protein [bacterium]
MKSRPAPVYSSPIGIELRGRWMKAAQRTRAGWTSVRVHREVVAGPHEWCPTQADISRLAECIHAAGIVGHEAVLGAPSATLLSQSLELPPRSSGAPIDASATAELARASRFESSTIEAAVWDTPGGSRANASSVLVMGLDHPTASELLALFRSTPLDIVAIDAAPAAIGRTPEGSRPGAHAFVDLGWDDSVLSIFLNGLPIYQRRLDDGGLSAAYLDISARDQVGRDAIDAVLLPSGLADPEVATVRAALLAGWRGSVARVIDPLATELERSLSYASLRFPSSPLLSVSICGDGAPLPGLLERLQTRIPSVPVATVPEAAFAVARGLALWNARLTARGSPLPAGKEAA